MAKEMKKPGSPKGTPGKAAGPAKAKEKSKTREMRGYIAPAKKKATPSKASTSYSPEYMSNRAQSDMNDRTMKKQLSKYGMSKTEYGYKLNAGKPKRKPKAGSATISKVAKTGAKVAGKVAKRAKTVAREVRDVKTAFGTSLRDQEQNVRRAVMGVGPTKRNVGGNLKKQIREAGSAIKSGKKGTPSDEYIPSGAYTKGKKRK